MRERHVLLFGCEHVTVAGEAVARSVNLAQARLAGANQGFREPSPRRRTLVLSEVSLAQMRATCLSEEE